MIGLLLEIATQAAIAGALEIGLNRHR